VQATNQTEKQQFSTVAVKLTSGFSRFF